MGRAGAGAGAPDPAVESVNGESPYPGLGPEELREAAVIRREEAQAEHDAAYASAQAVRDHAASLNQTADDMEEGAEAALAAAMAAADEIERQAGS